MERIHRFGYSHGSLAGNDEMWMQYIIGPDDRTEMDCHSAISRRWGYDEPLPPAEQDRIMAEELYKFGCRLGPVILRSDQIKAAREKRKNRTKKGNIS